MKLRWPGKYQHFEPFWGCTQYPDCRGRRNILPNGEPEGDEDDYVTGDEEEER